MMMRKKKKNSKDEKRTTDGKAKGRQPRLVKGKQTSPKSRFK